MTTEENDYSLPYEEYLKNFRKTHHHQAVAMSKDQYKQMQAKAGVKTQEASPEGNGMVVNGVDYSQPFEVSKAEHQKKYGLNAPFASEEEYNAAKSRIWNQGASPDVDDTKAMGATKEELDYMLQNGQISRAAYEKQIATLQTPEVQEEMETGEKKADETVWDSSNRDETENANAAITDSVSEAVTPKKDDPSDVGNAKKQYNKSMMSIWDAYRNGEISKETAGYFTIDAIATLAKNLGRSIGNVGAQFSGGTIDNGHDESKWGQRQNALLNEEIGKETESLGGAAGRKAESENIANLEARIRAEYSPQMLDLEIKNLENEVKKSGIDVTKAENSQALIEHIKQDPNYEDKPLKMLLVGFLSQTGVGGAVNTGASALEKLALLKG